MSGWVQSPGLGGPVSGSRAALLLRLLVQLHVGHQDVLLGLLGVAGAGAAVASPFVGPLQAHRPPTVQVDHADDQRHQHQACHYDDDQSGQMVAVHWGIDRGGKSGLAYTLLTH